jgi:hypothetical protein
MQIWMEVVYGKLQWPDLGVRCLTVGVPWKRNIVIFNTEDRGSSFPPKRSSPLDKLHGITHNSWEKIIWMPRENLERLKQYCWLHTRKTKSWVERLIDYL